MGKEATIPPPDPPTLLTPLIRALSSRARPAELPNIAPILRQRVELLSDDSSGLEPWYRYLCYDPARAAELVAALDGGTLNPHPASGDVEVDWEADGGDGVAQQFRRLDEETLEACVVLRAQGITFKLRYDEGEGRGWKVAEVSVAQGEDGFGSFDGSATMEQAEEDYARMNPADGGAGDLSGDFSGDLGGDRSAMITTSDSGIGLFPHEDGGNSAGIGGSDGSDSSVSEDDDEYWNSYGRSPNRTPGPQPSPPPPGRAPGFVDSAAAAAEDAYYARYENVQPALDPHPHPHDSKEWEDGGTVLSLVVPQIGNGSGGGTNGNGQAEAGSNGVIKRLPQMTAILEESEKEEEEEREEAASAAAAADAAEGATARGVAFRDHVRKSIESLGVMASALGIDQARFAAMVRDELVGE